MSSINPILRQRNLFTNSLSNLFMVTQFMERMGSEPRQLCPRVRTLNFYQESEGIYLLMSYYAVM